MKRLFQSFARPARLAAWFALLLPAVLTAQTLTLADAPPEPASAVQAVAQDYNLPPVEIVPNIGTTLWVAGANGQIAPYPVWPGGVPAGSAVDMPAFWITNGQVLIDATGGSLSDAPVAVRSISLKSAAPSAAPLNTLPRAAATDAQANAVLNLINWLQSPPIVAATATLASPLNSGLSLLPAIPKGSSTANNDGPELGIGTDDDNFTRIIYFDSNPGSVYNIQSSTNLIDWTTEQTVIATDTNYNFWVTPDGVKFYRVELPDDRLQFPDWTDYVEAFAYFNVHTTIQGTYHLELYADGALLFQTTDTVPPDGNFGVHDGSYDPAQWPNVGAYAVNEWELRVTVTPSVAAKAPGGGGSVSSGGKKRQRFPSYPRHGLTVEMAAMFKSSFDQLSVDTDMATYLNFSRDNVSYQYALAGTLAEDPGGYWSVPKLQDANDWYLFKWIIYDPILTDLHYFGHGSRRGIGADLHDRYNSISLAEFQNTNRLAHPLKYAAMDGCQTAKGDYFWQSSKLLKALCGYDSKLTILEASSRGQWARFAWGWTTKKTISFADHLIQGHWTFLTDFYNYLSIRDNNGFLRYSFNQAIYFAQHPKGQGSDRGMEDNPDGYFLDYLGTGDAMWDY